MTTLAQMVDEVSGHLRAYSSDQESKTSLVVALDAAATVMTVADADRASSGLVEVDEELIEVSDVNTASGEVTIFPWGRAQQGTAAAVHDIGARVTMTPRFPHSRIKRVIGEVVAGIWPDLFAVKSTELVATSAIDTEYGLPADVRRILSMRWDYPPYGWQTVRGWRINQDSNPISFPTGTSVEISESIWPGQTIRIVYACEPGVLVNDADDYATTTGLPDGSSDLICLGAAARLVTASDLAATQVFTVEHAQKIDGRPVGGASAASRYLMQLYQTRLNAERRRLFEQYPVRMRRTW